MPRKKYDSRKVNIVGDFFEDILGHMVKGERAPADEGDFHVWEEGLGIEVKGSDTNHEWRLPLHQLEFYERMSNGFPLDSFFFFLFCYKNPYLRNGDSKRITSLSQFDDEMEIRNFIVTNLDTLYVIDIVLIQHLFSICRVSDKSIPLHRGVKSLNVRPTLMRLLADGGWKSMSAKIRGLEQRSFSSEFVFAPDMLESHKVKLNVATIGRAKETQKLIRCFKPGILT